VVGRAQVAEEALSECRVRTRKRAAVAQQSQLSLVPVSQLEGCVRARVRARVHARACVSALVRLRACACAHWLLHAQSHPQAAAGALEPGRTALHKRIHHTEHCAVLVLAASWVELEGCMWVHGLGA
jgi:hypothetical protein